MRALRKGQAESYYFSHSLGEIRLLARFFGTWTLSSARRHINFNICNSAVVRYVKNTAGRQRYLCSHCRKTLQLQFTYTASQPGKNQKVIYMDMNNVGCRVAARIMGIRLSTIFRHLKNSGSSQ